MDQKALDDAANRVLDRVNQDIMATLYGKDPEPPKPSYPLLDLWYASVITKLIAEEANTLWAIEYAAWKVRVQREVLEMLMPVSRFGSYRDLCEASRMALQMRWGIIDHTFRPLRLVDV